MRAILVFILFLTLVGCSDSTEIEEQAPESTPEVEDVEKEVAVVETQPTEPVTEEKDPSYMINLIDPNTKEIITSISTIDLGFYTDYSLYEQQIEQLAKDLARGTESRMGFDQIMILDKANNNGELIEGHPMVLLKESELVEKILSVSPDGGDIELPLYITETGYNRSEYNSLNQVAIATYTTYFNSSDVGRTHNINQSSEAISKVIIGVGDYFSFNTTVGPRTKETGYQEALEIVNGEFVLGIGGGICQTSSTLFNAVDQLGVRFVEWHHHSRDIGYVPKGRDATVSYGTLDFRFQNTTNIPLMIVSTTTEDSITVEIRTSQKYANLKN